MKVNSNVPHPSLREICYNFIKDRILDQTYPSGSKIDIDEIAKELGVSTTPVREAISQLTSEGLIYNIPRRGFYVSEFSPEYLEDIFDVREQLEILAVEKATEKASEEDIEELKKLIEKYKASFNRKPWNKCYELDRQFHEKIAEISKNKTLINILRGIGDTIQAIRTLHCKTLRDLEITLKEHTDILFGISSKDPSKAKEAMKLHLDHVKRDLIKLISSVDSQKSKL
jgi:DNA-binding GntR family transcriptional regulator